MRPRRNDTWRLAWLGSMALGLVWTECTQAHVERGQGTGFVMGFGHPWSGFDHVLAMIAVGIWGAQLGAPALWLLQVVFPMVMARGAFLGLIGLPLPGVEVGIALSAVLLGAMVGGDVRPRLVMAVLLVGAFAVFHLKLGWFLHGGQ
jgi:urease accessory protein